MLARHPSGYAGLVRAHAAFVVLALLVATGDAPRAQILPADGAAPLIARLTEALETRTVDRLLDEIAPHLPADERRWLIGMAPPTATAPTVILHPRARTADALAVDAMVIRDTRATVASWRFGLATTAGTVTLTSVIETARFDDLVRLDLAPQPLAVRDLTIQAPDFELTLASGMAFASSVDGAYSALVLLGRSSIRFAPRGATEQGQLRIFTGTPGLAVTSDEVFVRINPLDSGTTVRGTFTPLTRAADDARVRAARIFDERVALGHVVDSGLAAPGRWGLAPVQDSLFVDFRTRRHGWLTYTRTPNAAEDVSLAQGARRLQIARYSSRPPMRDASRLSVTVRDQPLAHTDLDVAFDPDRQWLHGRVSLRLHVSADTPAIPLRLAAALRVTSIMSPQLGPLLFVRSAADEAVVGLPRRHDDTPVTIVIDFEGTLPPHVLDDDTPTARRAADLPDALGVEPRFLYSGAIAWYPQPVAAGYATATMRVTVPATFDVVATGERRADRISSVSDAVPGSAQRPARTVAFNADRPVRYLAFVVARMTTDAAPRPAEPGQPVVHVVPGPGARLSQEPTPDRVSAIIRYYTDLLGGPAYPTFTAVSLRDHLPGGHSPAYFALVNTPVPTTPYVWDRDPLAFTDEPDFFLAHEIAHQWFGQSVAGRDYHEQWISEGFAQYLAWMYVTSVRGDQAGQRLLERMRASIAGLEAEGPIRLGPRLGHLRGDRRVQRALVYNKGALVLHMLRRLIGDDAFVAGLRDLLASHQYAFVSTGDVERAFQRHTTLALARFFERWIDDAATPTLRFSWAREADGHDVAITVTQAEPVFDLPHTAVIHYADGRRDRVPVAITGPTTRIIVPVDGAVRRVELSDSTIPARLRR